MNPFQSIITLEWYVNKRSALTFVLQAAIGPLLYILLFLPSLSNLLGEIEYMGRNYNYVTFVLPGMMVMNSFLLGQFAGIPVRLERRNGELEVLFSLPIPRWQILSTKVISVALRAVVGNILIMSVGVLITSQDIDILKFAVVAISTMIPAILWGCISIGLAIVEIDDSAFNLLLNLISGPLFYASTIFYPIGNVPAALRPFVQINPLTYSANLTRSILLTNELQYADIIVLVILTSISLVFAAISFNKIIK